MRLIGISPERARDLKESSDLFGNLVWPKIGPLCGGGELWMVESGRTLTEQALDLAAGIDAFQVVDDRLMRSLSTRVQWSDGRDYSTFTVRYSRTSGHETEYSKRKYSIELGYMYPFLTIQAYTSKDKHDLLSAAAVRTDHLYEHIQKRITNQHWLAKHLQEVYDGNEMLVVSWGELLADNRRVEIFRA